MKKWMILSGVLSLLLASLLLTGRVSTDTADKEALRTGNALLDMGEYASALAAYEEGLSANADNKALQFGAAQAAYLVGNYGKAAECFDKSEASVGKFLGAGNTFYRVGEAAEDIQEKAGLYAQALKLYEEGIMLYPQDVSLKFNYEFVFAKLEELLEETEQESEEQGEDGEEGEEGESQEGQSGEDGENQEEQAQESSRGEEAEGSQSEAQEGDEEQESYAQGEEEGAADEEAIARVLQMLEAQEEQSLKNNQEVASGNEGKNGW